VNPAGGGPIEAIVQLASVNKSLGHDVEIACLDSPDDPWITNCLLKCYAFGPGFLSYRWSARFTRWLRENCHRFDAVIINGIWHYNSFGTWRILQKTNIPYFVYTHGMLDPWFKRRFPLKHLKKRLFWRWTDFRVLRDANAVLFTSEEECRLAPQSFRKFKCRPVVVNYGTAGPPFPKEPCRESFLQHFPALRDTRSFLFIGRIHEKKGVDLLLRAFFEVCCSSQTACWKLVIAGPQSHYGNKMKKLAEQLGIAERVLWTGMLSGVLKWGALYHADAFALPSHQENFGMAVAEALSCGLPVLISNRVNIWRGIQEDGAGLVEEDSQEGTVRLLKTWIEMSPCEQATIRSATRSCFERRFNVNKAASSLIETIQKYSSESRCSG
jgi:glycosyltransferase involved in cell wall biosynthesis